MDKDFAFTVYVNTMLNAYRALAKNEPDSKFYQGAVAALADVSESIRRYSAE